VLKIAIDRLADRWHNPNAKASDGVCFLRCDGKAVAAIIGISRRVFTVREVSPHPRGAASVITF
jgi:hypothetical protein